MQADETPGDYISRAKAKLVAWNEARNEADTASRFDRCAAIFGVGDENGTVTAFAELVDKVLTEPTQIVGKRVHREKF
ncbi:hypothetical protein DLM45_06420 [Hyphomicrobium methylovorum]|uniref:hypothetical protein n=1 Tax=Hyphomicrobium methylovorum TaxID=84 RepID=UPI0015E7BEB1|nr:hypothetical protein [Hyphomicrobium methylovorum]MBA2125858.1 hypothetical protein [Hyphomicrobium methylovorum]